MKVLITNLYLDGFGGTEAWCYAVAMELKRRGHRVDVYTPLCGKIFNEFAKNGVCLSYGGDYDLILDNHSLVDFTKFHGKCIHTVHGITGYEQPLKNVVNVAVSKKISDKYNIDIVIPNGIDTNRFKCKTPLHNDIKKILSLCKSDTANDVLKTICTDLGVGFESMYGKEVFNIEDKINESDLVVGVGRSLLDAMSCGRPVVSFDDRYYFKTRFLGHGYITPDKYKYYEQDSFTANSIGKTLNKLELAKEIFEKYNPKDGEINRYHIVKNLSIETTVNKYLDIYSNMK